MTTEQQLANTQRVLQAVQRRNTSMWNAYTRLLDCQSAAELALELRSERTVRAFQVSTGERLFTESEVKPLVDALVRINEISMIDEDMGCAVNWAGDALAHAKELGL